MYCTVINKDEQCESDFDNIDDARHALVQLVDAGVTAYIVVEPEYHNRYNY